MDWGGNENAQGFIQACFWGVVPPRKQKIPPWEGEEGKEGYVEERRGICHDVNPG